MPPRTLEIGPITLHVYGAIIALAILIGWSVARYRAKFYKIPVSVFEDWVLIVPLVLSLVGARIYHVLDYWSAYKDNLQEIIQIQNGGLGIWGALAGALIGFYFVCKLKSIKFKTALDAIAPALALGQAIGRIGNWVNQEGFGPPTTLPWAITISPENRPQEYLLIDRFHPTFFYEAIANVFIFLILMKFSKNFNKPGQIFGLYLIGYSLTRFAIEFLRIDTWAVGTIKIAQVVSIVTLLVGIYIFKFAEKSKK